jgi:hypothetical protein
MADLTELKADLVICLQTQNLIEFKSTLFNSNCNLNQITDFNNFNIFHDIALASLSDSVQLDFLTIILAYSFRMFEEKGLWHVKNMLNTQSSSDSFTPLMIAVQTNKIVRFK